jgi:hypothetical protein
MPVLLPRPAHGGLQHLLDVRQLDPTLVPMLQRQQHMLLWQRHHALEAVQPLPSRPHQGEMRRQRNSAVLLLLPRSADKRLQHLLGGCQFNPALVPVLR